MEAGSIGSIFKVFCYKGKSEMGWQLEGKVSSRVPVGDGKGCLYASGNNPVENEKLMRSREGAQPRKVFLSR